MSSKARKIAGRREPDIKILADKLKRLADEADRQHMLLLTKATIAKLAYENGASLVSMSMKLGWPIEKLARLLQPDVDIEIRELSDVFWSLNHRVSIKAHKGETILESEASP